MAGWHQTIVIGNVGKDPEMRYTQAGQGVCSFSVAVTETWNDKQTNEKREKTTWYSVSCWRKLAETANQYVHKGMKVMIVGNVDARGYTNNAGELAASLELTANTIKFLSGGNDSRDNDDAHGSSGDIPF